MISKAYQCDMRGHFPKWLLCLKRKTPLLPYIALNKRFTVYDNTI